MKDTTAKQLRHLDRKWLKTLKRSLAVNKRMRDGGYLPKLDPERLPK